MKYTFAPNLKAIGSLVSEPKTIIWTERQTYKHTYIFIIIDYNVAKKRFRMRNLIFLNKKSAVTLLKNFKKNNV